MVVLLDSLDLTQGPLVSGDAVEDGPDLVGCPGGIETPE